jgi:hypothetical protein
MADAQTRFRIDQVPNMAAVLQAPMNAITRHHGNPGRILLGGIQEREPYPSELKFFEENPHIPGMSTEDNKVIISPYAKLSKPELDAVRLNEASRVFMEIHDIVPDFDLTAEQENNYASYGSKIDILRTITARILSGDPSAGPITQKQSDFAAKIYSEMNAVKE